MKYGKGKNPAGGQGVAFLTAGLGLGLKIQTVIFKNYVANNSGQTSKLNYN